MPIVTAESAILNVYHRKPPTPTSIPTPTPTPSSTSNQTNISNNDSVEIDGQRFVGSTLWFPATQDAWSQEDRINDFRYIDGFSEWVYPVNIGDWQFAVSAAKPVVPVTDTRF